MMATAYSFLTLILCLLTGGGNDLLDYLPTEAYWNEKGVTVSVEAMIAELAEKPGGDITPFIADLGSPDAATRDEATNKIREKGGVHALSALKEAAESPDAEVRKRARGLLHDIGAKQIAEGVRRLMAIRTLGEIGKADAIEAIKPLLQSKELFEPDYAQTAIDQIEGKKSPAARAVAANVADDVWLLPQACRTVGQLVPRRGSPLGFAEFLAAVKGTDSERKSADAETTTQWILTLAEMLGNVRIDAVTYGIQGNPFGFDATPHRPSSLALVVRGRFHADWLRSVLRARQIVSSKVNDMDVFDLDGASVCIMPSDEQLIYLAGRSTDELPIKEITTSLAEGKGPLAADESMRKLVESIPGKQVLWGAALVSDDQREIPVFGAFDTVTLLGTREGKTLTLKMTGVGSDPDKISEAAAEVKKHAQTSAEFLSGIKGFNVIALATELLQSVKVETQDQRATLTATLETTPAAILSLPALSDDGPEEKPKGPPAHPRLKR
jgi:hypothetical protein